jgi:hypothetical protein
MVIWEYLSKNLMYLPFDTLIPLLSIYSIHVWLVEDFWANNVLLITACNVAISVNQPHLQGHQEFSWLCFPQKDSLDEESIVLIYLYHVEHLSQHETELWVALVYNN